MGGRNSRRNHESMSVTCPGTGLASATPPAHHFVEGFGHRLGLATGDERTFVMSCPYPDP
jgi:hypothetical protein